MIRSRLLDGFEDIGAWTADASDGVKASARVGRRRSTDALCASISISGRSAGYAFVRRKLPLELPENFEISFNLRADAPVKQLSRSSSPTPAATTSGGLSGATSTFPSAWRRIKIKKRQIAFAWGPTQDRTLRHSDSLEFVVAAGRGGGNGLDRDRRLDVPGAAADTERTSRRLRRRRARPWQARGLSSLWTAKRRPAGAAIRKRAPCKRLTVDLGMLREFGGIRAALEERRAGARLRRRGLGRRRRVERAAAGDERGRRQGRVAPAGPGSAFHQDQSSRSREERL